MNCVHVSFNICSEIVFTSLYQHEERHDFTTPKGKISESLDEILQTHLSFAFLQ